MTITAEALARPVLPANDQRYASLIVQDKDRTGIVAAVGEHLRLLRGNVDFIVLARYMQILSGDFIAQVGGGRSSSRMSSG